MVDTVSFDSLVILRTLDNLGKNRKSDAPYEGEKPAFFKPQTLLSDSEFEEAMEFLYQNQYLIDPQGKKGKHLISDNGEDYLASSMENRQIDNLIAEQILKALVTSSSTGDDLFQNTSLMEKFVLVGDDYIEACQELDDLGFLMEGHKTLGTNPFLWIQASPAGRNALRRNFNVHPTPTQYSQIGVQITGGTVGNVQGVAEAIQSNVQQTISESSTEELLEQISEVLKSLVDEIANGLTLQQKQQYTETAINLEKELSKSSPEQKAIMKWMARLAFLDIGFGVGKKSIELMNQVMPFLVILGQYIQALLSQ